MFEISDTDYFADDEVNRKAHSRLLDEVLQLDRSQYVKKPSRTEPSTHVSEFNLVKPSVGRRNTITIEDLTKPLKQKSKHVLIGNKIKSATSKATTLRKPLEKPQAEKIRRSVGFQKTKIELNKWNSVVDKNRVAVQLTFPLDQGEVDFKQGKNKDIEFPHRYKSEFDKELEKLEPETELEVVDKFPLSMEELMKKRKEMARLRAHQSYQEAKAYKRNKIKSKTFHKIQRKERIRQQIKEFEELKKSDPNEALRKLEQLEKTRAEERMTLRHRSTGQWAKSKQVRAKYDKESRQALAQQLTISRELTENRALSMDTDSESDEFAPTDSVPNSTLTKTYDVANFITGYRKFWEEENKIPPQTKQSNAEDINTFLNADFSESENEYQVIENNNLTQSDLVETAKSTNFNQNMSVKFGGTKLDQLELDKLNTYINKDSKLRRGKPNSQKVIFCNNQWTVTDNELCKPIETLENMFAYLEYETLSKVDKKIDKLRSVPVAKKRGTASVVARVKEIQSDLKFSREKMRPEVDEELTSNLNDDNFDCSKTKKILESVENGYNNAENGFLSVTAGTRIDKHQKVDQHLQIDPNEFMTVKEVKLGTKIPTITDGDDNSDNENDQRAFIAEAFQDDDLIVDFDKEKQEIIDKDKPQDVDLTLPGWGSWGSKNIKVPKRKRKRFIVKAPTEMPRRDDNKGSLIINEHKDTKVRKHQVSEMPFPFKSVKDFEASIRAPIGDTFVPQTAFRRLIKPSLVTKKGTIIEPMSKDLLLNQKFTQQGFSVKR